MLELEVLSGQDLREKLAKKKLAQASPELRRAQNFLERGDVSSHVEDSLALLGQGPERVLDLAEDLGGFLKAGADGFLGAQELASHVGEPVVELLGQARDFLLDARAKAFKLLLQEKEGFLPVSDSSSRKPPKKIARRDSSEERQGDDEHHHHRRVFY